VHGRTVPDGRSPTHGGRQPGYVLGMKGVDVPPADEDFTAVLLIVVDLVLAAAPALEHVRIERPRPAPVAA